jgi:O-antigen ligase
LIWLLGLFFSTLLVGMSPMEIAAGLLSLGVLCSMWKRRSNEGHWTLLRTQFDFLFFVWIAVIALGFVVNQSFDQAALIKIAEFKWILFLYLLLFAIVRSRITEEVFPWVTIPVVLACGYAIAIAFGGTDLIKDELLELSGKDGFSRTGGLFSDAMTLAHVYGIIFCWFFGCLLTFGRYRERRALWLALSVGVLGLTVLLTFTRGVWASVAAATLLMSFIFSFRLGVFISFLGALSFGGMYEFWPSFQQRVVETLSSTKGYDSERLWIWKANWQVFRDHPILGVGYGHNRDLMPEYFKKIGAPDTTLVSHAHNQYLHFLAGTGVVGLLVYLLVLFLFLKLSFKVFHRISDRYPFHRGLCLGLIGAQVTFVLGGITEANFESSKVKYAIVMTWALVLWLAYEYRVLKSRNF